MAEASKENTAAAAEVPRRHALSNWTLLAAGGALAAAYGTLAAMMGRFLFPAGPPPKAWMYVSRRDELGEGESLLFKTPSGATVNVARQGSGFSADDFVALSSVCPHLGCQVHWEPQNDRYFCPCHNGVFTPEGTGIGGPPGDAGQSLSSYPLKVENGLLYIEVDRQEVALGPGRVVEPPAVSGPGHDPCLAPCACRQEKA